MFVALLYLCAMHFFQCVPGTNPIKHPFSLHKKQTQASSTSMSLRRQKAVLPRARALESAMVLMSKLNKAVLTVEFTDEIGHGLGPTLEFYSLVCTEISLKSSGMWRYPGHAMATRPNSDSEPNEVVTLSEGLFPAVLPSDAPESLRMEILSRFEFLGQFIAKVWNFSGCEKITDIHYD